MMIIMLFLRLTIFKFVSPIDYISAPFLAYGLTQLRPSLFSGKGNWKSVQLLRCSERYVQDVARIGEEWTLPKEIRRHSCVKCMG